MTNQQQTFSPNPTPIQPYHIQDYDVTWHHIKFTNQILDKNKVKLYDYIVRDNMIGVVKSFTYEDQSKYWWQFWRKRVKTGFRVLWRDRDKIKEDLNAGIRRW